MARSIKELEAAQAKAEEAHHRHDLSAKRHRRLAGKARKRAAELRDRIQKRRAARRRRQFKTIRRGGGWGGSEGVVKSLTAWGIRRQGLSITSAKGDRGPGSPSDHDTENTLAFAYDISNSGGRSGTPADTTPEMDATAKWIADMLDVRYERGAKLEIWTYVTVDGVRFRVQVLYRTSLGGNHFNHLHVGVERA